MREAKIFKPSRRLAAKTRHFAALADTFWSIFDAVLDLRRDISRSKKILDNKSAVKYLK